MEIALESSDRSTPPGRIGIWLFLASEIMFFMGLLGSYVLFRAADPRLFAQQSVVMNKWAGGINTVILMTSSFLMAMSVAAAARGNRRKVVACLSLVLLLAASFLGIKSWEYRDKLLHYTLLVRAGAGKMIVYDGHVRWIHDRGELHGFAAPAPGGSDWNIHLSTPQQVRSLGDGVERTYEISRASVVEEINDGPWKNMFFACYFTLTAVHAVHLLAGMIAVFVLLILAIRDKISAATTEYIGIYWHFVDLVWILMFVLLYLL